MRRSTYRTASATIVADVAGKLWWPNAWAWKENIAQRIDLDSDHPDGPLREALLRLTQDGDFQGGGSLAPGAALRVERCNTHGTVRIRYWTIRGKCWATDDMLLPEAEVEDLAEAMASAWDE